MSLTSAAPPAAVPGPAARSASEDPLGLLVDYHRPAVPNRVEQHLVIRIQAHRDNLPAADPAAGPVQIGGRRQCGRGQRRRQEFPARREVKGL